MVAQQEHSRLTQQRMRRMASLQPLGLLEKTQAPWYSNYRAPTRPRNNVEIEASSRVWHHLQAELPRWSQWWRNMHRIWQTQEAARRRSRPCGATHTVLHQIWNVSPSQVFLKHNMVLHQQTIQIKERRTSPQTWEAKPPSRSCSWQNHRWSSKAWRPQCRNLRQSTLRKASESSHKLQSRQIILIWLTNLELSAQTWQDQTKTIQVKILYLKMKILYGFGSRKSLKTRQIGVLMTDIGKAEVQSHTKKLWFSSRWPPLLKTSGTRAKWYSGSCFISRWLRSISANSINK